MSTKKHQIDIITFGPQVTKKYYVTGRKVSKNPWLLLAIENPVDNIYPVDLLKYAIGRR